MPLNRRHGDRIRPVVLLLGLVEDLEDSLSTSKRLRHPAADLTEPLQGSIEQQDVAVEGHHHAQGKLAVNHLPSTEEPQREHATTRDQAHGCQQDRPVTAYPKICAAQFFAVALESAALFHLLTKSLHSADAGNGLAQARRESCIRPLPAFEQGRHPPPEKKSPGQNRRDGK